MKRALWQVSQGEWIGAAHIRRIEDDGTILALWLGDDPAACLYTGDERLALLSHLTAEHCAPLGVRTGSAAGQVTSGA